MKKIMVPLQSPTNLQAVIPQKYAKDRVNPNEFPIVENFEINLAFSKLHT